MTSRNLLRVFLVAGMMTIAVGSSCAGDFTFYVGGVKPGSITFRGVSTPLDSSPIFGFRLRTDFVPLFGLEHTIGFSSDYLFPHHFPDVKNTRGFVYNSNLIVDFPTRQVVPYLTAGLGVIHQYGSPDLPVGTKFALNYGGGLKFPRVAGPLWLRFDLRGYNAGVFSNKLNMFEMTGGIVLSFGR